MVLIHQQTRRAREWRRFVMTTDKMGNVPNNPKTPLHSFRVSDEAWKAAQENAARLGENFSEELRKFVDRYAKKKAKGDK